MGSGVIDLMTGSAPLHAAARGGSAEAVKAVLDAGADIEARDGNGWTALRVGRVFPERTEHSVGCPAAIPWLKPLTHVTRLLRTTDHAACPVAWVTSAVCIVPLVVTGMFATVSNAQL